MRFSAIPTLLTAIAALASPAMASPRRAAPSASAAVAVRSAAATSGNTDASSPLTSRGGSYSSCFPDNYCHHMHDNMCDNACHDYDGFWWYDGTCCCFNH